MFPLTLNEQEKQKRKEVERYFSRIGKKAYEGSIPKTFNLDQAYLHMGTRLFKRKLMGFFGCTKISSLTEISTILEGLGVADNPDDAKIAAVKLDGVTLNYGAGLIAYYGGFSPEYCLSFSKLGLTDEIVVRREIIDEGVIGSLEEACIGLR